jgi:hypothetical protein
MFRVASTFDAASSGNEVLLLKNSWNDRFTWITQFYVTVVDADAHAHPCPPSTTTMFTTSGKSSMDSHQRSRLPSEVPSRSDRDGDTQLGQHAAHPKADRASQRFTIVANSCCLKGR